MAKYPQCSRHASTFICVLDLTRALESFTSRFVSLAALKRTAGLVFRLPTGRHFSWGGEYWPNNTALQQELVVWACWAQGPKAIESAPRKVPDEAPETSKIDLRMVQHRAPGRSKWPRRSLWAIGRRQLAAKTAPKPFLGSSRSALGGSWARPGALRALFGTVLGPGALGRLPWRLREATLACYFGGRIEEALKLIDFIVSDSFMGFVSAFFICFLFLTWQGFRRPRPRRENFETEVKHIRFLWDLRHLRAFCAERENM